MVGVHLPSFNLAVEKLAKNFAKTAQTAWFEGRRVSLCEDEMNQDRLFEMARDADAVFRRDGYGNDVLDYSKETLHG